ncbi:MAG: hypothetical protein NC320_13795 [Clostridium sp.]|nr:hypothetical protein [Clostridium sp.]
MKKTLKKALICALACTTMLVPTSLSASAAHKTGCAGKTTYVKCGSYITTTYSSHTLHTNASCSKTGTVSNHSKACTSCDGNLGNIGSRVCKWVHQYCPDEYGVCQY